MVRWFGGSVPARTSPSPLPSLERVENCWPSSPSRRGRLRRQQNLRRRARSSLSSFGTQHRDGVQTILLSKPPRTRLRSSSFSVFRNPKADQDHPHIRRTVVSSRIGLRFGSRVGRTRARFIRIDISGSTRHPIGSSGGPPPRRALPHPPSTIPYPVDQARPRSAPALSPCLAAGSPRERARVRARQSPTRAPSGGCRTGGASTNRRPGRRRRQLRGRPTSRVASIFRLTRRVFAKRGARATRGPTRRAMTRCEDAVSFPPVRPSRKTGTENGR